MDNLFLPNDFHDINRALQYFENSYTVPTKWYTDILTKYAKQCETVVEFGVWNGQSALVFANAGVKEIISCDIDFSRCNADRIQFLCKSVGSQINFRIEDSQKGKTNLTADLMFFDTCHTYKWVKKELRHRAHMAKKYFIVHDTNYPPDDRLPKPGAPKVRDAVKEYIKGKSDIWELVEENKTLSGIMVVKRK